MLQFILRQLCPLTIFFRPGHCLIGVASHLPEMANWSILQTLSPLFGFLSLRRSGVSSKIFESFVYRNSASQWHSIVMLAFNLLICVLSIFQSYTCLLHSIFFLHDPCLLSPALCTICIHSQQLSTDRSKQYREPSKRWFEPMDRQEDPFIRLSERAMKSHLFI